MATVTNTFQTFDAKGIREDLTDVIYNIDPTDTPFMTGAGKAKATATLHEWQKDNLAAAVSTNAQFEGDDVTTFTTQAATVRLTNYCQIFRKDVIVSGTVDVVNKAGRNSEVAYQTAKRMKELKRDIEKTLLENQAKTAGALTVARLLGGVGSWVATNDALGTSGVSPTGTGADTRTDGTQRAYTEALLKTVIQGCWTSGGDPDTIMLGAFNKQAQSGFAGNATRIVDAEDKKLIAAYDVYESDFGAMKVVPNRFSRARDGWVFEMDKWAVAYLRPVKLVDLAKTGDAEKKMVLTELTLECRQEAASGLVADLTSS